MTSERIALRFCSAAVRSYVFLFPNAMILIDMDFSNLLGVERIP